MQPGPLLICPAAALPACLPACLFACCSVLCPYPVLPAGASVKDHLLTQYQKALMAVVAAQFGKKSVSGGKDGVLSMAQQKGEAV